MRRREERRKIEETLSETASSGKGRARGRGQGAVTRTNGDWLATDAGATGSRKCQEPDSIYSRMKIRKNGVLLIKRERDAKRKTDSSGCSEDQLTMYE
jgi:hypothetical protein